MATCKECLHIAVCGRYSATGGHVKECEHYVPDNNVGKWIPVKERLPEQNTEFIIVANCKTTHTPRIVRRKALVEVERWGVTVGFYAHNAEVTHWMPLPKVPEEETE